MVAPNVKWDHSEDWCVANFDYQLDEKSAERQVDISLADPEFDFIRGHFIDGMNVLSRTFFEIFFKPYL